MLEQCSKRRGEDSSMHMPLPASEAKLGSWDLLKGFILVPPWQAEQEADQDELT